MSENEETKNNEEIKDEGTKDIAEAGDVAEMPQPERPLLPRQRKLAELAAQGLTQKEMAKILHYTPMSVCNLLQNPRIAEEVVRIRERVFEESVVQRLKKLADPAVNVIEDALTDRRNRYKKAEQIAVAQWVVEKLDGKATQKYDVGENLLGVMLDKLDAMKTSGHSPESFATDVTPRILPAPDPDAPEDEKSLRDQLKDWSF